MGWPLVCILAADDFASRLCLGELYHGVRGASLGTMLISFTQAAGLSEQTADGLMAKIADFGLSTLLAEAARASRPRAVPGNHRLTRAGRVMGTPTYMAPELAIDGLLIHPSVDMYAFGVLAHELLVGRPPFRDPLFVRRVHGRPLPPPPSLLVARPRLEPAVADVVDRCLALDPAARPTAREASRVLSSAKVPVEPTSVQHAPLRSPCSDSTGSDRAQR